MFSREKENCLCWISPVRKLSRICHWEIQSDSHHSHYYFVWQQSSENCSCVESIALFWALAGIIWTPVHCKTELLRYMSPAWTRADARRSAELNGAIMYNLDTGSAPGFLLKHLDHCLSGSRLRLKSPWIMQVRLGTSPAEDTRSLKRTPEPRLRVYVSAHTFKVRGVSRKTLSNAMKTRDFMFSHISGFLSCFTCWFVCEQEEERGRCGTNFMDFEALRREPDPSVKIYLSTQKQTSEGRVRDWKTCDGTEESMYSYFKSGRGSSWAAEENLFLEDKIK